MRRSTSNPLMPAALHRARQKCLACAGFFSPLSPSCTQSMVKPSAEDIPHQVAEFYVVVDDQNSFHYPTIVHHRKGRRSKNVKPQMSTATAWMAVTTWNFYKTLLWLTDSLPLFPTRPCSYEELHKVPGARESVVRNQEFTHESIRFRLLIATGSSDAGSRAWPSLRPATDARHPSHSCPRRLGMGRGIWDLRQIANPDDEQKAQMKTIMQKDMHR